MKRKKFNPVFVVDLTNVENQEDAIQAFIDAKKEAGIDTDNMTCDVLIVTIPDEPTEEKKLPWYKRFWNWITRKK